MKVGVIGLGTMGMGAALNLLSQGPHGDRLRAARGDPRRVRRRGRQGR